MNHADRQQLSQLLEECACALTHTDDEGIGPLIDEARAIVDRAGISTEESNNMRDQAETMFALPPNPALDAFLTEPIHEYTERTRTNRGNHRPKHRALSPLRAAIVLTLACLALVCLTASSTPTPGRSHQPDPVRRSQVPPRTAEVPWPTAHQPGTFNNTLRTPRNPNQLPSTP